MPRWVMNLCLFTLAGSLLAVWIAARFNCIPESLNAWFLRVRAAWKGRKA